MTDTELSWAPASCSLPTVERPLREREFDDLFREELHAAVSISPVQAEFRLNRESRARAEELVARETECCSFFTFALTDDAEHLTMTVGVPDRHSDVLSGLIASAERAAGTRS